ncbi:phage tail family protein [Alkalicoccobacillus gibsonii]|uniref:phage tail protein n=1 Tax=Alkalicoccobacillus gibsonii TaxID=79881 RepID=UPI0019330559|nr:phage tail protein [Alkalicoccobacillus gibsonii]MBM0064786.1 phage tail protein [Alkalicoccobacillus gibsonii]
MSFTGIEFNGLHSFKDLGLTIESRDLGNPSKVKIMEDVPYSNMRYDFSSLYGEQQWTERTLVYKFNIAGKQAKEYFYLVETEIQKWLTMPNQKIPLYDDMLSGFYYLAEVQEGSDNEYRFVMGTLTVTFTAYPYKIGTLPEGNDDWDEFMFDLDYAQDTSFTVNGLLNIELENVGSRKTTPEIDLSSNMQIIKDGVTYSFNAGKTTSRDFTLKTGTNQLRIIGNGTASFNFHKELI